MYWFIYICVGTRNGSSEVECVSSRITMRNSSHVSGFVSSQVKVDQLNVYHQVQENTKG